MLIQIENLTKFYPRQDTPALDDVSLNIPRGSVFGLLGPNGAGKTTLISILVGLQKPSGGKVLIDGEPLASSLSRFRSDTGFVPQDLAFYPMLTVKENLDFYIKALGVDAPRRRENIDYALEVTQLQDYVERRAERLSGGLKRRLNLAIGLLNRPGLLILDEPTVGIDPQSRNFILNAICEINRNSGTTIIYTSHYMQEVEQICDTIAILNRGRVRLCGSLQELLSAEPDPRLVVRVRDRLSPQLLARLRESFAQLRGDGYEFSFHTEDMSADISSLLSLLQQNANSMTGLRHGFHGLEQLYMQQMHEQGGA